MIIIRIRKLVFFCFLCFLFVIYNKIARFNISNFESVFNIEHLEYILYPDRLCKSKTLLIAYVLSAPNNFQNRMEIRKTWSNNNTKNLKVLFLIGSTFNMTLEKQIKSEHIQFNDILQGNFFDSYLNLTYKTIMGIRYLADHCLNGSYFIAKIDDDVMVNTRKLVSDLGNMLIQNMNVENRFFCNRWDLAIVQRSVFNKFYVPVREFGANVYPTYCDGPAYIYSNDMLLALRNATQSTKIFRFEDVYIGLLAAKLNSQFISIKEKYSDEYSIDELIRRNKIDSKYFFYPVKKENFSNIWKKIN